MGILFMDGFDTYATGAPGFKDMFSGVWTLQHQSAPVNCAPSSDYSRTGEQSLKLQGSAFFIGKEDVTIGYVLPSDLPSVNVYIALFLSSGLSTTAGLGKWGPRPIYLFDSKSTNFIFLACLPSGALAVYDYNTQKMLCTTGKKVLEARTWHTIEMRYAAREEVPDTGHIYLYVDGARVANYNHSLDTHIGAIGMGLSQFTDDDYFVDDLIIRAVDFLDGPLKETGVYTLPMVGDGLTCNWTPSYMTEHGTGSFYVDGTADAGIVFANPTSDDIRLGDTWTMETWFRLYDQPDTNGIYSLITQWHPASSDRQSWRLYLGGSAIYEGALTFEYRLTGSNQSTILSSDVRGLDILRWYHIAVSRSGTKLFMFLDGVLTAEQDIGAAFNYAYAPYIYLGTIRDPAPSSRKGQDTLKGQLDETRLTNGAVRYDVDFVVPESKLPRKASADPQWSHVVFLMGYDGGLVNEAPTKYVPEIFNGSTGSSVKVISVESPDSVQGNRHLTQQDGYYSSYVENRAQPAYADVSFASGAALSGTWGDITLTSHDGAYTRTYTFVTSSPSSDQVLIGTSLRATLTNFVRAVNHGTGEGVLYGSGTLKNSLFRARIRDGTNAGVRIETRLHNAQGNASKVAVTGDILSVANAGVFAHGLDQPLTTQFVVGDLPADVTKIHGIQPMGKLSKIGPSFVKAKLDMVVSGKTLTTTSAQVSTNGTWHYKTYSTHANDAAFTAAEVSGSVLSLVQDPPETG